MNDKTTQHPGTAHDICVVSGRYPASAFDAHINHRIYCALHGYTYIHCNWPTQATNRYFNKIEYLNHYFSQFKYLFWIDDDAFFMSPGIGLEHVLPPEECFLSICRSPDFKSIHTFISSGQFALRCNSKGRSFLNAVRKTDLDKVKSWWAPRLGFFSNGDQDAIVYLLHTDKRFREHYIRHPYRAFNSRIENLLDEGGEEIFILHFTGRPSVKLRDYHKAQKFLARGPSLLPREAEQGWNIARPPRRLGLIRLLKRIALGTHSSAVRTL